MNWHAAVRHDAYIQGYNHMQGYNPKMLPLYVIYSVLSLLFPLLEFFLLYLLNLLFTTFGRKATTRRSSTLSSYQASSRDCRSWRCSWAAPWCDPGICTMATVPVI